MKKRLLIILAIVGLMMPSVAMAGLNDWDVKSPQDYSTTHPTVTVLLFGGNAVGIGPSGTCTVLIATPAADAGKALHLTAQLAHPVTTPDTIYENDEHVAGESGVFGGYAFAQIHLEDPDPSLTHLDYAQYEITVVNAGGQPSNACTWPAP